MKNALRVSQPDHIRLEALPYTYPMRSGTVLEAELRQIEKCVAKGYKRIELRHLKDDWISICGYGPSLAESWKDVSYPLLTVSGAHDFLIERGIIPDFHAECDGRDHKTKHLEKPNREVMYLMATVCNPKMWDQLDGCEVEYWHCAHGKHVVDWIGKNDSGATLVAGGSTVGLAAIHIAGILGFRKFRLFGFDGNLRDGVRHSGPHYGPPQKVIKRQAGGKSWETTPQMSNACDELLWLMRDEPQLQFEVVGDSLMRSLL